MVPTMARLRVSMASRHSKQANLNIALNNRPSTCTVTPHCGPVQQHIRTWQDSRLRRAKSCREDKRHYKQGLRLSVRRCNTMRNRPKGSTPLQRCRSKVSK
mmetsp:Transcript_2219/g.6801  ORF Transcript_2219/g.6801 Transcript_2219/m.6801 type:complete len:101 (+) Transcript_2219:1066-1368(+)